jgi:hypothetical protein
MLSSAKSISIPRLGQQVAVRTVDLVCPTPTQTVLTLLTRNSVFPIPWKPTALKPLEALGEQVNKTDNARCPASA